MESGKKTHVKSQDNHFRRRVRGQAFDTMMLVISVIVAIAILGVLMSILGGIKIGVNDPTEVIKTELKKIVSAGYGISQAKQVDFAPGEVLPRAVIGDTPISASEIEFYCGDQSTELCGGSNGALSVTRDDIIVTKNSKAFLVICGDDSRRNNPKYCVAVGRQADDARVTCKQKCLT